MTQWDIESDILERLMDKWAVEGIQFSTEPSLSQIESTFLPLMQMIPRDLVVFYRHFGGIHDYHPTKAGFALWSLERVASENSESSSTIIIGDYGLDAWYLCARPENEYRTSVWYEDPFARGNGHQLYRCLRDFTIAAIERPLDFFAPR